MNSEGVAAAKRGFTLKASLPSAKARVELQRVRSLRPPTRVARMIALAHHIQALVDRRLVSSIGEVGRSLGVSDTRMVQVCDLALLSPRIQEALLLGRVTISPRTAQKLFRLGLWDAQERGFRELLGEDADRVLAAE